MDNNTERDYRVLELGKVLEMLAAKCSCADTAEEARRIQPQTELNKVHEMLQQTSDAYMLAGRFGTPGFSGAPNISNALRRAQSGAVLSMGELLRIASVMRTIRLLRDWRSHCEGVSTSLDGLFMTLASNNRLEEKIVTFIDSPEEMNDRASAELYDIRRKIKNAESRVRQQLDNLIRSATYQKYLQESLVTMRDGRFVVPVKAEFRSQVAGLVHDTSSSGATVFIEPMAVVETNNDIKLLKGREQEEIERILTALSMECGENADMLIGSYRNMIELDLLFAKANLAYDMDCSLPVVKADGIIDLKKARHPLIHKKKVVPSDIRLGEEFDTLMITGPNTGGKTVTLKTLGLLTAMTMCGLMIPAGANSRISVFDNILADIGDEQSIEQSLSTFSAHMTNIIRILNAAGEHSLVLLDELGAGTDPIEGAALAESIIETLREKGAKTAATTHYAELKSYALTTHGVENGSCEFDVETLRPTYKLLIGMPGRSNAFAICAHLGMPEEVVERAQSFVSGDNTRVEDVVAQLDSSRQEMERRLDDAEKIRAESEALKAEMLSKEKKLEEEKRREIESARREAERIVSQARSEADDLLKEIDRLRKDYESAKISALNGDAKASLRARLRRIEDSVNPVETRSNEGYVLPRALKIGDTVEVFGLNERGTVVRLPDKSGNVEVQMGIIKSRVGIGELRLIEDDKVTLNGQKRQRKGGGTTHSVDRAKVQTEVDVRGCTVEEGILEVDRVIDHAVVMKLGEVRVIHGKGTGALRAGLHQHFRKHPNVQSFRLGVYGEGETGVTILELKK